MGLSFANPLGLLALLGIPAILAIHLFQLRSRRIPISTLFLLEASSPRSEAGRTRDRLRASASLWLQLAAVLVAAWLLAQPRWLREDSLQRTAIVVDASLSMDAFLQPAQEALARLAARSSGLAHRREWTLVSSGLGEGTLYSGSDTGEMLRRFRSWGPRFGAHDPRPALRAAREAAGRDGRVVFLTDRDVETEAGVELLAVGAPIENVGFAGLRNEDDAGTARWRAIVRNYGTAPATREWGIRIGTAAHRGGTVTLAPGASEALSGGFPPGASALSLALDADPFTVDDTLPIVLPSPKRLTVRVEAEAKERLFVQGLLATLDATGDATGDATRDAIGGSSAGARAGGGPGASGASARGGEGKADLVVASRGPGPLALSGDFRDAVVFLRAPAAGRGFADGPVIAENDPLMEDLSWKGLLVRPSATIPAAPGDRVLLWQGMRPLVFLRDGEGGARLVFDFPVEESNADRLPSFVLLFHRFVESVRRAKVAPESANVEIGQLLDVAVDPKGPFLRLETDGSAATPAAAGASGTSGAGAGATDLPASRAALLRAPGRSGFFTVRQGGGAPLLTAAGHFADVREADFRDASSRDGTLGADHAVLARNARPDPLAPLWTIALAGLLVVDWALAGRRA